MWTPRLCTWTPRLLILVLTSLVLAGCTQSSAPTGTSSQTVGSLHVTLANQPVPHTGDNMLTVTITDAQTNAPIGNANVTATPNMLAPALAGTATSGRAQGNGVYQIPVRLGIATRYNLNIHIVRPGHSPGDASFIIEATQ